MIESFKQFLRDSTAWDMYISGRAGTGKTYALAQMVKYCMDNDISYTVCAYTHKACGVIAERLPADAKICTLHSLLHKRPTINQDAIRLRQIDSNVKTGKIKEKPSVIFIDEWSMIGEKDYADIRLEQDPDYDGEADMQIVWLGDPNQLPPVGDIPAVVPYGQYSYTLTKIHRQAADNPLMSILDNLVSYIEGTKPPAPLEENSAFIRNCNLVTEYHKLNGSKILLAFTNDKVQYYNQQIAGKHLPDTGDEVFSPVTKQTYTVKDCLNKPSYVDSAFNGALMLDSKYKTLEHLHSMDDITYYEVVDEDDNEFIFPVVFGSGSYNRRLKQLKTAAAESNAAIEREFRGYKAAGWAKANFKHPLARARAKAWRDFLTFDDYVTCLDFPFAQTVHKSQGSTYDYALVDINDINDCIDLKMRIKLLYVAISRAKLKVFTS